MDSEIPSTSAAEPGAKPPREAHCRCRTDRRSLVLLAPDLAEAYPELMALSGGGDWAAFPELGAVRVELGAGRRLSGAADLVGFLSVLLPPGRLAGLRAAWVSRHLGVPEQLDRLLHAGPLAALAPGGVGSPLAEILRARRLETWYQPIVAADDGALWGYECLMRGRTADGLLVPAGRMIAWSRQDDLTFLLDRLCREAHLRNASAQLAGREVNLLLNFLPTAIYDPAYCLATTIAAAEAGGIAPGRIIFEVVETERVADLAHLQAILGHYRRSGFRVALDDLGSGYSGLTLLGDLDPDLIKIDRHLIARAVESPMHRSICASLARLGRDHGKLVLAEGVETHAERDLMAGLGVDLFQGYLFGRPAPEPAEPLRP